MSKIINKPYPEGDSCKVCGEKVKIYDIPPNAEEAMCEKCGWSYYRENV